MRMRLITFLFSAFWSLCFTGSLLTMYGRTQLQQFTSGPGRSGMLLLADPTGVNSKPWLSASFPAFPEGWRVEDGEPPLLFDVDGSILLGSDPLPLTGDELRVGSTGAIMAREAQDALSVSRSLDRPGILDAHPDSGATALLPGARRPDCRRPVAARRGLERRVHLVGPRPVSALAHCMSQADLLVSPRVHGTNTPMKVYSYLDSGRAVVATDLPTHTQVMSEQEAALVAPEPGQMGAAILRLLDSPAERERLAANASRLVQERHSWTAFRDSVRQIFGRIEEEIHGS